MLSLTFNPVSGAFEGIASGLPAIQALVLVGALFMIAVVSLKRR